MNSKTYKNLKIGDKVILLKSQKSYFSDDHINTGEVGIISAIKVPSVCREKITFACVDFPYRKIGEGEFSRADRCACLKEEMDLF